MIMNWLQVLGLDQTVAGSFLCDFIPLNFTEPNYFVNKYYSQTVLTDKKGFTKCIKRITCIS